MHHAPSLPSRSLHQSSSALPPCTVLLHYHHGPFIPAPAHFHRAPCSRPSSFPASCCPKGRIPLLGVRSPRSPSFPASCCPEGRIPLLGVRSPRPHLSLPLGTIDPLVRHSEYLHSATQNRAAQRVPCARTQSSGPITDLELIKSRDCSCTPLCIRVASQLRRLCYSTI